MSLIFSFQQRFIDDGMTAEYAEQMARQHTGFDPDLMVDNMTVDIEKVIETAVNSVETVYKDSAEATFEECVEDASAFGKEYTKAVSNGVQNGTPSMTNSVKSMGNSAAAALAGTASDWSNAATKLIDAFISGIKSNTERAVEEAVAMANSVREAVEEVLAEPFKAPEVSPNVTVTDTPVNVENGMWYEGGASSIAKPELIPPSIITATEALASAADKLENAAGGVTNSEVVEIHPAKAAVARLSLTLSEKEGMGMAAAAAAAVAGKAAMDAAKEASKSSSETKPSSTTVNFTQNNYSPKSLDRTSIYRGTKSAFNTIKNYQTTGKVTLTKVNNTTQKGSIY